MAKATKGPLVGQITDNEERKKALNSTLGAIEKQFGKGAIMKLGDKNTMNVQTIPTGCLELDISAYTAVSVKGGVASNVNGHIVKEVERYMAQICLAHCGY